MNGLIFHPPSELKFVVCRLQDRPAGAAACLKSLCARSYKGEDRLIDRQAKLIERTRADEAGRAMIGLRNFNDLFCDNSFGNRIIAVLEPKKH
jgi:hypothetical protein